MSYPMYMNKWVMKIPRDKRIEFIEDTESMVLALLEEMESNVSLAKVVFKDVRVEARQ